MTDGKIELTRRKILAATGAVGAAGAGAGMSTSAFFSDEESFEDNTLTAGELDMKVDWEEHYSDWKGEETAFAEMPAASDPVPGEVDYYLPVPMDLPNAMPIALNFTEGQDAFWDATAIEALPDTDDGGDGDGIQDEVVDPCGPDSNLADVGADDGGLGSDLRTNNDDTFDDGEPLPLVNLSDVKPGDFGEVTFSFHLCTNPGYVWMQGDFVGAAENGLTEPEAEDAQEDGEDVTVGSVDDENFGDVELLDAVRTRFWYDDNCDNQLETNDQVDVMLAVDDSISQDVGDTNEIQQGLSRFAAGLPDDSKVGAIGFGNGGVRNFQAPVDPANFDPSDYPDDEAGEGNTPLPAALDIAAQAVQDTGRPDAQKVVVPFTDGGPNYFNNTGDNGTDYSAGGYSAPRSAAYTRDGNDPVYDGGGGGNDAQGRPGGISDSELVETAKVAEQIRDDGVRIVTVFTGDNPDDPLDTETYLRTQIASSQAYATEVGVDDLAAVANSLAAVTMEENVFFQGCLREALLALSSGKGIPLDGDTGTSFNEFSATAPDIDDDGDEEFVAEPTDEDREPFSGEGTTHCVGFEWWLPLDHANEIQTDSASFNVGFYAEQGRHNDGAGQPTETDA